MGKMSALPAKQETLLRWLMMDLKTKPVPYESSNKQVNCFTGSDAVSSLLNSFSPSIKKQIKSESDATSFIKLLLKDAIIVRGEKVYNDEKKYCIRKHHKQVFIQSDKYYWGINTGINYGFLSNIF